MNVSEQLTVVKTLSKKEKIAKRVAQMFRDGSLVNLGVGLPTLIPSFIPKEVEIWAHAENGIVGVGPPALKGEEDYLYVDAGNRFCTIKPGGSFFGSATSFGLIRGGHVDFTVLGAMQVDEEGNLANWMVPGGKMAGMGGAMDLVVGAKKVIVASEHCTRDGSPKILKKCTFPLTGARVVDIIVTELAYIEVTPEGLLLKEISADTTIDEVISKTEAELIIADDISVMNV
ncbi:MAG: 3-oxoacid CoA-transferase subunit B [Clostridiales bacterium]|nr:3-oxoacid CoA-transferase subunit B [Clostridiales bacterium]